MTPTQNLHFAIGELAYTIARADGAIQKEERQKFQEIVLNEMENNDNDFAISDIIFQILEKDKFVNPKTSYDWTMNEIKLNSHYLSPELKKKFISVIEKVAKSFPPVTIDEMNIIEKFKKDIEPIIGDPVYYEKKKK